MNNSIALFDFCETLVDFQTADRFIDYIREESGNKSMCRKELIRHFLDRTFILKVLELLSPGHSINKRLKLSQLRGYRYEEIHSWARTYYTNCLKPHFIPDMIERIKVYKQMGYKVGLVSGGYGIYLNLFLEEYCLDFCISSNIEFDGDVCTGKLSGLDCLNNNKVILLNHYFQVKPQNTIGFSDSKTDIPFLRWVNKGVVVSKGRHQSWIDNYNFDEIIWK